MAVFPNASFLCVLQFNYVGFPWVEHYCFFSLCSFIFSLLHSLHLTPLHQSRMRSGVEGENSCPCWGEARVIVTTGGQLHLLLPVPWASALLQPTQGSGVLRLSAGGALLHQSLHSFRLAPHTPLQHPLAYSWLSYSYFVLDPCGLLYFQVCVL